MEPNNKICTKCNAEKPCNEFSIRNDIKGIGYRKTCKQCDSERRKKRYTNNLEKALEQSRLYRENNPNYQKEYLEKNPTYFKDYYINNSEHIKTNVKQRIKERRLTDPLYALSSVAQSLINGVLRRQCYTKRSRTYEILGCSYEDFKIHLESKFEPWMNWGNRGNPNDGLLEPNKTWDMDHIIPLSSATTEEELLILLHHTNIQPLCSYINRVIKRDKY